MKHVPRIGLDQGCPRSCATLLMANAWDVVHVGDIGLSRATDLHIMEWALSEQRVVVTLDSDFHMLLALNNFQQPSVIRIRQEGLNGARLANLLLQIWPRITDVLALGAAITITDLDVRIRKLPLKNHTSETP